MNIRENISLKPYNTFGIDVQARNFISVDSVETLREALKLKGYADKLILGGGSNMLLTSDIEALVLHIDIRGISIERKQGDRIFVKAMAGENWHEFVLWTLDQDFGGLENLSLIPGNTGTAPVQNIGAYGVELDQVMDSCEALEVETGKLITFSNPDCQFAYRDSYFKRNGKGKYIITSVTFRLTQDNHKLNTSYGAIEQELAEKGIKDPDIRDISEAVIAIRSKKLPDPTKLGNSGSFFKNPVINKKTFEQLKARFPEIPHYPLSDEEVKIPAGWLIEQCGFKGKRFGDAGVHKNQALVLVNYGNASGGDILKLAMHIREVVADKFGIKLEPEVNILGNLKL